MSHDIFYSLFICAFNANFPFKKRGTPRRMTPRQPWITMGLMKSCAKKSKLYKKFCQTKKPEHETKYIIYRNKLKTLLVQAKRDYYSTILNEASGDSKKTWKILGEVLNQKPSTKLPQSFT